MSFISSSLILLLLYCLKVMQVKDGDGVEDASMFDNFVHLQSHIEYMVSVTVASGLLSVAFFCIGSVLHDGGYHKMLSILAFVPLLHHLFEKFFNLEHSQKGPSQLLCILSIAMGVAMVGYF